MNYSDFFSSDPNISDDKLGDTLSSAWKPATFDVRERHLRIAEVIEMRDVFKNGRVKQLKDIFGNADLK